MTEKDDSALFLKMTHVPTEATRQLEYFAKMLSSCRTMQTAFLDNMKAFNTQHIFFEQPSETQVKFQFQKTRVTPAGTDKQNPIFTFTFAETTEASEFVRELKRFNRKCKAPEPVSLVASCMGSFYVDGKSLHFQTTSNMKLDIVFTRL